MSILEGAYWISFQQPRKYLKADADGSVWGVDPGPRGIDVLDSAALRARIWLAEKATDGQNFIIRNYETGLLLDGDNQSSSDTARVVATRGYTEGQLWEVNPMSNRTGGPMYQIKSVVTSGVLGLSATTDSPYKIILDTHDSQQPEGWLIEPVLLPTLYSITNQSHEMALCAPIYSNLSDSGTGAIKLQKISPEHTTRNHLWMLEYISLNEAIVRSASYNRFALDLASDSQTVLARKHHGGPSQRWTVKDEGEATMSLVNAKTGTSLAIQQREFFKERPLSRLVAIPDGATQWQIKSNPQPPLFWVTIQDQGGALVAQVDDGPLVLCNRSSNITDHTAAQWRFIMIGDGMEYVIENRATGFMFGANATADRNDANFHWRVIFTESGSVNLINNGSKNLVFRGTGGAISTQQAGYQSYDYASGRAIPCQTCDWYLKPAYDNLPSFAIINSYTGRCLTNDPIPNIGTVSTATKFNDFRSQWHFHAKSTPSHEAICELPCALSNKMSGNSLEVCLKDFEEIRVEAYNDLQQSSMLYSGVSWRLLSLSPRLLALCMNFGPGFLYDPGDSNSQAQDPPQDIRSFHWYLVSHREAGFDFISLAFSTTGQVLEHISSRASETPWDAIQRNLSGDTQPTNGPDSMTKCIPLADNNPRTMDGAIRVALAFLIAQWTEDSIPERSVPRTIISATRNQIERQWEVCLSEHVLRHNSDRHTWIRIDLQGVYDVDGTGVADIQGQWLDSPVFRVAIPVEVQVSHGVIQRAMLQSLNQGLAVQVRATPPSPRTVTSENARLDIVCQHGSKPFIEEPLEPRNPDYDYDYDYDYDQQTYKKYQNDLALYNSNLAAYKSSPYWKLRSADMRFINQLVA